MSEDKVLARQNIEKAVLATLEQGLGGSCVSLVSFVSGGQIARSDAALGGSEDGGPTLGGSCVSLVSFVSGSEIAA